MLYGSVPGHAFQLAWETWAALRGWWALMLRTGWVVVRRTVRVSWSRSMVTVSAATWTVTTWPAWMRPRAIFSYPRRGARSPDPGPVRLAGHIDVRVQRRQALQPIRLDGVTLEGAGSLRSPPIAPPLSTDR
jgi:hypothetical protein